MTSLNSQKIKVVFLTFYYEAWNSLAQIHDLMLADSRFDVTVISIPRRFTFESEFAEEDQVSQFFDHIGVKHTRFNFADSFEGLAKLKELSPDYVFINYPWQRNYQPGYRVEELSLFTKVCYVPYYSAPLVIEPDTTGVAPHLYMQRSHQLAALVFTQDPDVYEAYGQTSRGNSYVYLTGTPKLDSLRAQVVSGETRWPLPRSTNTRLVWAPHHSYSSDWLNFGTFAKNFEQMLGFAKAHPQVDVVLRPHPLMFATLIERHVLPEDVLNNWLSSWNELSNTAIDTDGEIAGLFAAAELFLTDGISFLVEYPLATNKPVIFMENPGHWQLSPLGELAADASIRINEFSEFEQVFEAAVSKGLPDRSEQIDALRKVAQPHPGESAARIIEVVIKDFDLQTPLVDKSLVTEIAWESRPSAEPAWD